VCCIPHPSYSIASGTKTAQWFGLQSGLLIYISSTDSEIFTKGRQKLLPCSCLGLIFYTKHLYFLKNFKIWFFLVFYFKELHWIRQFSQEANLLGSLLLCINQHASRVTWFFKLLLHTNLGSGSPFSFQHLITFTGTWTFSVWDFNSTAFM
jgi:hypothetical protein